MNKQKILILLQLIVATLILVFLGLNQQADAGILFWPAYLAVVIFTFLIVAGRDPKYALISLIILDLFIALVFQVRYPEIYHVDRDSGFEAQYAQGIIDSGRWDPSSGVGYSKDYYGYTPMLHFIMVMISELTGLSAYFISKYILIYILRIAAIVLVYLIYRELVKKGHDKIALFALLIYLISPRLRIVYISRRFMASIFVMLFLYGLLKSYGKKQAGIGLVLAALSSVFIVTSDHSISIMFLLFMLVWTLSAPIFQIWVQRKVDKKQNLINILVLAVYSAAFFIYRVVVTPSMFAADQKYIQEFLDFVSSFNPIASLFSTQSFGTSSTYVYSKVQTYLAYASQLVIAGLAGLAILYILIKFMRRYNEMGNVLRHKPFIMYFSIFGLVSYALLLLLARTDLTDFYMVFIWFSLLPVCFMISLMALRVKLILAKTDISRVFLLGFVLIVYIGGFFITYHPDVIDPDKQMVMEFIEYKNDQLYGSADWLASHAEDDISVLGDKSVFDIYAGMHSIEVFPDYETRQAVIGSAEQLRDKYVEGTVWMPRSYDVERHRVDYFIVNTDIARLPSFLFGDAVSFMLLDKFDDEEYLARIYDDGKVWIYDNRFRREG